ncbi:hypothetical protein [Thermochromatium tepidum]|uniref:Peptidase C-terminal archaeal/bacterial domain-containing protein n=1 Tax=Thermochromatium tepidum ATCC 43061 TaxID=316276 RepID=A0A6I6EEZ6_THETI|nr:hypothetical protein [Thermochromatium tepidum]QGU33816.1 hypothetical protein E6P07_13025 [Thermochromatium tepidum ATCC 43061]
MKPLMYPVAGLALLLPIALNAASLGGYPPEETCKADREASYAQGYAAGQANGWNLGHQAGHDYGIRSCVANPLQFGVTLASVIPPATYGETEPNDNFISADPLVQGANFWGQLYGLSDQDWFYTQTTAANQNILVTFSVPSWINDVNLLEGKPAIWNISVRDAAGNIFANYNTNVMGAIDSYDKDRETYYSMTYSVTAGLAGSYYIVVKPADGTLTSIPATNATIYPYSVAVVVQDSPLPGKQPIVGFYDSEVEPNDVPSRANPLATGVTMYGLINLTFNVPLPGGGDNSDYVWGQGEDDWFVYKSNGNEIATLNFCAKESCGPGNWFVEVYDQAMASRFEAGERRENLRPLLSINTDTTNDPRATFRVGLRDPGYYFMRVNHKRLFTAPCLVHQFVSTTSETGFVGACECEGGGGGSCDVPTNDCSDPALGLVCKNKTITCSAGIDPGCQIADGQGGRPRFPADCPIKDETGAITTPCATYQTLARCSCSQYGGTVEVPKNEYTSPYNFTWHGTQLPPSTLDTDAYEDFLKRPNPYTP